LLFPIFCAIPDSSILDVKALTDKEDKADIEVQLKDLHNSEYG
jgi:hypothetical protein